MFSLILLKESQNRVSLRWGEFVHSNGLGSPA